MVVKGGRDWLWTALSYGFIFLLVLVLALLIAQAWMWHEELAYAERLALRLAELKARCGR